MFILSIVGVGKAPKATPESENETFNERVTEV
jgi:hypothetical protein